MGITLIPIYSASPWENGFNERYSDTLYHQALDTKGFRSPRQTKQVFSQRLRQYNHIRPREALGMRPPVTET